MVPVHSFVFSFDGIHNCCLTDRGIISQTNGNRHLLAGFVFKINHGW
jgi:hypothetical protein